MEEERSPLVRMLLLAVVLRRRSKLPALPLAALLLPTLPARATSYTRGTTLGAFGPRRSSSR